MVNKMNCDACFVTVQLKTLRCTGIFMEEFRNIKHELHCSATMENL